MWILCAGYELLGFEFLVKLVVVQCHKIAINSTYLKLATLWQLLSEILGLLFIIKTISCH